MTDPILVIGEYLNLYAEGKLKEQLLAVAKCIPKLEEVKVQQYIDALDQRHAMMLVDWKTGRNDAIKEMKASLRARGLLMEEK